MTTETGINVQSKLLAVVRWVIAKPSQAAAAVAAVGLLALCLEMTYEVIADRAFKRPADWSLEVSEYLMVAITMLAIGYVAQKHQHVSVDVITSRVRPRVAAVMSLIGYVAGLAACAVITWEGWLVAWNSFQRGVVSNTAVRSPLWPAQMTIPVGGFLICVEIVREIVRLARLSCSSSIGQDSTEGDGSE